MPTVSRLALPLAALLAAAPTVTAQPAPPVAAEWPVTLEMHGDTRVDPYFWLRERDDPETIAYLEAENAYFDERMAPLADLQEALADEIRSRIPQTDASVPYRLGDHLYYARTEDGRPYPIYARRPAPDGPEQVLLDVNQLAEGHDFYSTRVSSAGVSPDGRVLAWAADTTGRRFYTVRFLDLETGRMLDGEIPNVTGNLAWANDGRTLFYSKQDPQTLRWAEIHRHTLGTDAADDALVYAEPDSTFYTSVYKTRDDAYLVIGSEQSVTTEYRVLDADDPEGTFRVVAPRERGHEYSGLEHAHGYFYLRTNRGAENFRLVRAPEDATGEEHWEEVIPHREDVLLVGFDAFQDHLVVTEREGGLDRLRVRPWDDPGAEHYVAFDDPAYSVSLGENPRFDTDVVRFVYESPSTPPTTYYYDMDARERTLLKQEEVLGGFSPDDYQTERLTIPARDGAGVPVTLVYRRDRFAQDGSAPLLLYGYGSYGSSISPSFSAERLSLLDRGMAFAIAHIRGSETLGRGWYEDGKLLNKKNTFTDFVDVADGLVEQGYADPDRLYAMGGSAGGLLMGAVINLRPELFDGVIAHVPWVDVVTTMLDSSIPLTTNEYDEWGNPNDPEYYEYMLSYSPYDNVAAVEYPHLLVTTGLNDSQVQYWEPAKWVAKLRKAKTGDNLLLFQTNMGAGHGGASDRYERYRERARDWAFLLHLAGLDDGSAGPGR